MFFSEKMILEPFPAEHPYASHVPRWKMFPSFANTAEEPKRGVSALQTQPLSSETPAANYDVLIKYKTKGVCHRPNNCNIKFMVCRMYG